MQKTVAIAVLVTLGIIGFSAYAYTVYLPNVNGSNQAGPGSGTLNIYLADAPAHNATLKYLLINVTSITLKYSSNGTETVSTTSSGTSTGSGSSTTSTGSASSTTSTTSSVTSSSATSTGSQSGSGNRFVFNVTSSLGRNVNLTKLQGSSVLLGSPKVPAGNVTGIILQITGAEAFWTNGTHTQLKVVADGKLMIPVHFTVQSTGTTNLNLDLVPGDIHVSPGTQSVLRPVVHVTVVSTGPGGTETTTTSVSESETSSSSTSSTTST